MSNSLSLSNAEVSQQRNKAALEEVEITDRPSWLLTSTELKLLGIAGVGFFLDAYDLFIINPVSTMLQYRLYDGKPLPSGLQGFLKAGANIGSVIGQFAFGYAADALGRKAVYGKELMLIIIATILCISTPTGDLSPDGSLIYLGCFRILLGIGVGGDYPMSASVTSDRSNVRRRGTMLSYIFSNQGWGSLIGSIVVMIVLLVYKHSMDTLGETSKVDGVWRICVGVSLVPAFATLYQRLTLPESTRYKASRKDEEENDSIKLKKNEASTIVDQSSDTANLSSVESEHALEQHVKKKAHIQEFITYFSEWRHAKILIGTCTCWFLLDIACVYTNSRSTTADMMSNCSFYGINLNQNVVLQTIGFAGKTGTAWEKLFKVSTGGLIITALGFFPGYYATILMVEKLGRKWIQIQGFLLSALFLAILAGKFHSLDKVSFVVCFALLQFFFNFGANSTTYLYPAEVFPTRYRAFAHGISAACGKAGAIISALAFNALSESVGTPVVLWIFFACCILGAGFTLLLPEVKGRDPDEVLAQELKEKRGSV